MHALDLFAGAGGLSTFATMVCCEVVWSANSWVWVVEVQRIDQQQKDDAA